MICFPSRDGKVTPKHVSGEIAALFGLTRSRAIASRILVASALLLILTAPGAASLGGTGLSLEGAPGHHADEQAPASTSNLKPSPEPALEAPKGKSGQAQSGHSQSEPAMPLDLKPIVPPANMEIPPYPIPENPFPPSGNTVRPSPAPVPVDAPAQDGSGTPGLVLPEGSMQPPSPAPTFEPGGAPAGKPAGSFPAESLIPEFDRPLPAVSSIVGGTPANHNEPLVTDPAAAAMADQRLTRLEKNVFGTAYSDHDLAARLKHLETETFGEAGAGRLEERLSKLELKIGVQPVFDNQSGVLPNPENGPRTNAAVCGDNEISTIIQAIPSDEKAGDYFSAIRLLGGRVARFNKFPVRLHLPQASPEAWEKHLLAGVKKWNQYIPLDVVPASESADLEVTWMNHLLHPKLLGITRVVIDEGRMHVQIFMLRPTYYMSEIPERALAPAFLHELGHGLGLLGHSDAQSDIMYPMEFGSGTKLSSRSASINARDINTLKKVYEAPPLPSSYTAPSPMEWGSGWISKDSLRSRNYK